MAKLSDYASKLPTEVKSRYIKKLELINNVDPFEIDKGTTVQCEFPLVDASDIVSYLVLQTSFITAQQYKRTGHWKHITNSLADGSRTCAHTASGRSASLLDG